MRVYCSLKLGILTPLPPPPPASSPLCILLSIRQGARAESMVRTRRARFSSAMSLRPSFRPAPFQQERPLLAVAPPVAVHPARRIDYVLKVEHQRKMSISGALIICRPGGGWSHLISIALKVCIAVVNSALGARQEELCSLCVAFKELQDLLKNDLDPEGTLTPALRILHAGFALCSESTGNNTGDDAERIACLAAKKWLEKAEKGLRNPSKFQSASDFARDEISAAARALVIEKDAV